MHSQKCEAIVLRTYDIGEADRFCILLTRERGRVAGRAKGVRKISSRMGGALLPYQHITVELKELGEGFLLTSATHAKKDERSLKGLRSFSNAQEGIEVLLQLIQDDDPLPEVFDTTNTFLDACDNSSNHLVLAFTIRLLALLGFLPEQSNSNYFEHLSSEDLKFLQAARMGSFDNLPPLTQPTALRSLTSAFLSDQLTRPLKAEEVTVLLR